MATISASVGYLRGLSEPWDTIVLKLLYIHSVPTSEFHISSWVIHDSKQSFANWV